MARSLTSALSDFLAKPRIEVIVAEAAAVVELRGEVEKLQTEVKRLQYLYAAECTISMRYRDILLSHGLADDI